MIPSILTATKHALSITAGQTEFDPTVVMHINAAFSTLNQLGIGPTQGFMIEDDATTWSEFIGDDPRLNNVKTYVYLRVRLLFDPPQTGYLKDALESQIQQLEWRLNVQAEGERWVEAALPRRTDD